MHMKHTIIIVNLCESHLAYKLKSRVKTARARQLLSATIHHKVIMARVYFKLLLLLGLISFLGLAFLVMRPEIFLDNTTLPTVPGSKFTPKAGTFIN